MPQTNSGKKYATQQMSEIGSVKINFAKTLDCK